MLAIPVGAGWLLAVVMTDHMGVGIWDKIKCGEGIVPDLADMYILLEGICL